MLFNSLTFLVFFPITLTLYWLLRTPRRQNVFLVAASLFFYGWWDWRFCFLLITSTLVDYFCAQAIERARDRGRSPGIWLAISISVNLGILGIFKYYDFFVESAGRIWSALGWRPDLLNVVLPVGISFYTFQTLSYTIDVYRGKFRARRSLVDVAAYVMFFPQLVAGPIERAVSLIPQMEKKRSVSLETIRLGMMLILTGFLKKQVLADGLAPFVESCFGKAIMGQEIRPELVMLGTYAFAFQIYGDFSGYSDIARGVARLLGFNLIINFRQPYFSRCFSEIWHRWHISLSYWLRDYLYISLGGNRGGAARTLTNLMITMLLAGLWHGAAWNFVGWGGLCGVYLLVERLVGIKNYRSWSMPRQLLGIAITFHLWCLALIMFRADSVQTAWAMVSSLSTSWSLPDFWAVLMVVLGGLLVVVIDVPHLLHPNEELPCAHRTGWRLLICGVAVVCFYLVPPLGTIQFIYFQF